MPNQLATQLCELKGTGEALFNIIVNAPTEEIRGKPKVADRSWIGRPDQLACFPYRDNRFERDNLPSNQEGVPPQHDPNRIMLQSLNSDMDLDLTAAYDQREMPTNNLAQEIVIRNIVKSVLPRLLEEGMVSVPVVSSNQVYLPSGTDILAKAKLWDKVDQLKRKIVEEEEKLQTCAVQAKPDSTQSDEKEFREALYSMLPKSNIPSGQLEQALK
uniref:Uncharacterized protein n=1 Tax=Romanomermis culicivorax TaxID=13658 RepID=A0A915JLN8_ROMCU